MHIHNHGGEMAEVQLTITKIEVLVARQGCLVPYRTLHRFASERCGFGPKNNTAVRVADGDPGIECLRRELYVAVLARPTAQGGPMILPALVLVHGGAVAGDCWDLTVDEIHRLEPDLDVPYSMSGLAVPGVVTKLGSSRVPR
jgi:hypothetical protein